MGLHKGQCNNRKGRPRKPNKCTTEVKTWIQGLIDNNRELLEKDLKNLEPRERWQIIERLLQYTTPKIQSIEAHLEYDKLTDEHLSRIVDDLTKNLNDGTTHSRNKNKAPEGH